MKEEQGNTIQLQEKEEQTDEAVGYVLNTLDSLKLDDKTIIVFVSDNGGVSSGDDYATSNLPLRGGKGYQWEGGTRIPFLIKAPNIKNTVKKVNTPVMVGCFSPRKLSSSVQLTS